MKIYNNTFENNRAELAGSVIRLNGNHDKYFNASEFIE